VEAPTFSREGALLTRPGYDAAGRLWFHAGSGLRIPAVLECPSPEQVGEARDLLRDELLGDFPFADEAARAHALGAMLLPFARELCGDRTPLHLIDAPTPGTGRPRARKPLRVAAPLPPAVGRDTSISSDHVEAQLTTTDTFYEASGASPPSDDHAVNLSGPRPDLPSLPPDLIEDLAGFLADALIADIRQYPNLAEVQSNLEPTVESPTGLDRTDPPVTRGQTRQEHAAADQHSCVGRSDRRPPPRQPRGRHPPKNRPPPRGAGSPSATRKEIHELDKEAR
jgi:hypothetical protein